MAIGVEKLKVQASRDLKPIHPTTAPRPAYGASAVLAARARLLSRSTDSTRTRARTCSRVSLERPYATARAIPSAVPERRSRSRRARTHPRCRPARHMDCSGVRRSAAAIVVRAEDEPSTARTPHIRRCRSWPARPEGPLSQEYASPRFPEGRASARDAYAQAGIQRREQISLAECTTAHTDRARAVRRPGFQSARHGMETMEASSTSRRYGQSWPGSTSFGHPIGARGCA